MSLTMSGKGLSLSAKLTYAAFTPLVLLSPSERKAVATIGCESQVSFRGGPRWLSTKEIIAVEPADGAVETAVEVQEVDAKVRFLSISTVSRLFCDSFATVLVLGYGSILMNRPRHASTPLCAKVWGRSPSRYV